MTGPSGRVTQVRMFLLKHVLRVLAPNSELDVQLRFPDEWIVCSFCGEAGWGTHPHFGTPCPIAAAMADAAGLKMDAERVSAVRAGLSMEEVTRLMREQLGGEDE